jgi:hypothetical protein
MPSTVPALNLQEPDLGMLRRQRDDQTNSPQRPARRLLLAIGLGAAFLGGMAVERHFQPPWTFVGWVRHFLAAPSCEAARRVGLAPATRGTPGFWPRHDSDQDGIACEPDSLKARGYWLG